MQTPQILLMGAGIVLFIALIIQLFRGMLEAKTGVPLFIIVIIMIGYPTIQKITLDGDMLSIEKYSNQITQNPQDTTAANNLNATLNKSGVISALQNNPTRLAQVTKALTIAASARVVKDDIPAARNYLAQANKLAPNSEEVKIVQQHLTTVQSNATPQEKTAAKATLQRRFLMK